MCSDVMSSYFALLQLFSWMLVGYIFVFWAYGYRDLAYKYGKLVIAFLVGVQVGCVVEVG